MAKRDLYFRYLYRGIFLLITVLLCFGKLSGGESVISLLPIQASNTIPPPATELSTSGFIDPTIQTQASSMACTITGPDEVCVGNSIQLTGSDSPDATTPWTSSNTSVATVDNNGIVTGVSSGTVLITYKSTDCESSKTITVNPLPTVNITGANEVCSGSAITLTANAAPISGTIASYQWQRNGADISGATSSTYSANQAGDYAVTVTNSHGCSTTSAQHTLTVNPLPTVNITGANEVCSDSAITLTANAAPISGTIASYQWQRNGADISGATSSTYSANQAGDYTVTVSNSHGCSTTSAQHALTVNPLPTVNITGANEVCSGSATTLTANAAPISGTIASYQWQRNGTDISGATSSTYSANQTGDYTVTVSNSHGCSTTSAQHALTVNPLPTVNITGANEVCSGSATTLTANAAPISGTIASYQWQRNGTDISGATSSTYSANQAGDYTITVINSHGCSTTSAQHALTVNPLPTVNITGANEVCSGSAITLTANAAPISGTIASYQWQRNGTDISGATSSTYSANQAGDYTVTVINSHGCSTTSAQHALTVNPLPTVNITGANEVCSGSAITLTANAATSTGTITSYQWQLNGTNISGATSSTYSANQAGDYTVTVYNSHGCSTTSAQHTLTVNPLPTISVTPPTQPICPGKSVSIEIINSNNLPNPSYSWSLTPNAIISSTEPNGTSSTITGNLTSNDPDALHTATYNVSITSQGCTSNTTFSLSVGDITKPVVPTISSISRQCEFNPILGEYPTTTDNCDGTIVGTPSVSFPYTAKGTSTITWTFTDAAGNSVTANQVITINDTQSPQWVSFPNVNLVLECGSSTLPTNTGEPTASDNCGVVNVTYTEEVIPGNCPARSVINRTWIATDASNNSATRLQKITIDDTTPPSISCTSYTNFNPADVPLIDDFSSLIVSDNCTATENLLILPISEEYEFDNNVPGFCPTFLTRVYRVVDECGNYSECEQTFEFIYDPDCNLCPGGVITHTYTFSSPDETWEINDQTRNGNCCSFSGSPPLRCISYNFYLHEDAAGVIFRADGGAVPPANQFRMVLNDCETSVPLNSLVCLTGGRYHTVIFCKSGNNPNDFSIESIGGVILTDELTVRADDECGGTITADGLDPNFPITWSVASPNDQSLLRYLSCTDCEQPYFTPDAIAPATITYRVCGTLSGNYTCEGTRVTDCAEVIVNVLPPIAIDFDIDFDNICEGEIPQIHTSITPTNASYTYAWYDGYDGNGTLQSTDKDWQPNAEGEYSLIVIDVSNSGVVCSSSTFNFEIAFDYIGPTVVEPPNILEIECNDPSAEILIQNWLATATAYDDTYSSIEVFNDYEPFIHSCGLEVEVTFWAEDPCGNDNSQTSFIRIIDTQKPEWIDNPGALDRTINCNNAAELLAAQSLFPIANDECDSGLIPDKTNGPVPTDECLNGKTIVNTWVITDACGNTSDVFTQTITLIDNTPPIITCVTPEGDIAEPDICRNEHVSLTPPTYSDDCGTAALSWSLSGATTGTGGPELPTIFNVGLTTVTWIVTDACGLTATCEQEVIIRDEQDPILTCPSSFSVGADHLQAYASNVTVPPPTHSDNCDYTLTWQITLNGTVVDESTNTSDISIIPSPYDEYLYIGDNIVTYTLTDINGVDYTCSFTITVENEPELDCPESPIPLGTDPGNCTSRYDPDEPILLEGSQPITWVYTITGPDGTVEETVTFVGSEADPGPPQIGPYEFSLGTTTIHWTATNLSGSDECIQTIIVEDNQPPQFTPPDPFEFCVENLFQAVYNGTDLDIEPIPDHYLFKAGSTELDLDMSLFTDNCCLIDTHPYGIRWEIEFSTGETAVSGTGQPSTYGSDIPLWGDGTTYQNVVHTITYWVSDCHNIETGPFVVEITIKPRPQIIKY